jgi:hypothetical protein
MGNLLARFRNPASLESEGNPLVGTRWKSSLVNWKIHFYQLAAPPGWMELRKMSSHRAGGQS